jgi:hypothetical protein
MEIPEPVPKTIPKAAPAETVTRSASRVRQRSRSLTDHGRTAYRGTWRPPSKSTTGSGAKDDRARRRRFLGRRGALSRVLLARISLPAAARIRGFPQFDLRPSADATGASTGADSRRHSTDVRHEIERTEVAK